MSRDPNIYLERAKYFNDMANNNNEDMDVYTDEYTDEYYGEDIDEDIGEDIGENIDDFTDIYTDQIIPNPIPNAIPEIKTRRYYDPVTKHYYNIDRLFEPNTNPDNIVKKDPIIWYPENKLSFKTVTDALTGKFYRVNKVYDADGKYSFTYDPLNKLVEKKPGTNYYRPVYK